MNSAIKHNVLKYAWIALFLAGCIAAPTGHADPLGEVAIVYTEQALGELKPCGCAKEEDQGGIERRMGYFRTTGLDLDNSIVVDLGDNFKEASRQGIAKAETMSEAMARMPYDAVVPGEKDLIYGAAFFSRHPDLPWTAANLEIQGMQIQPYRIKTIRNGRLRIALIGLVDPDLFYEGTASGVKVADPRLSLSHAIKIIGEKESPHLMVLLTHMPKKKALEYLKVEGVDLVINGHIHDDQHLVDFEPVRLGNRMFVQPAPRGQKIGEVQATIKWEKPPVFQHRMVKLDSNIPSDEEMTQLYAEYNKKVEALFLESLTAKRQKKTSVYATEQTCLTCHAEAHAVWTESRHSHAYATLEQVNKAFDPECLACHTTGFNQPGGFISEVDTPELKNVQCEVCHGPRREHAKAPSGGFAAEALQACSRCHVPNHSPNFNFETYWPKIKH